MGQPDAERQSCVLTSAYSCLALKNHPTFGVKKHHVEIGIGSIFAGRNEGKVGTDVVLFSWFSPRFQEFYRLNSTCLIKTAIHCVFFFQVHIYIFLSKKLWNSGNPKEETQPIVDVYMSKWKYVDFTHCCVRLPGTNSLRLRGWLEQQQDICRLHMAVLQWTTEALLAESVVRGAELLVFTGLFVNKLVDWLGCLDTTGVFAGLTASWAHSSFIQCDVGKCSQLDHHFCRSHFTACDGSNAARDDEIDEEKLFLPPPRYFAASHINGTTHFGPYIAWMSPVQAGLTTDLTLNVTVLTTVRLGRVEHFLSYLGGGFKLSFFWLPPLEGMIRFDQYNSTGLQPPPRFVYLSTLILTLVARLVRFYKDTYYHI